MLERVAIRNFQSLRQVDLNLGQLTVIVGASSSGKSAFMRAMRAVASNLSGSGAITRGAKAAAITVHTGEHVVTLERTETSGAYRLVSPAGEQMFTKLNRSVPAQVTEALRIQPAPTGGTSVNFAGQFDGPYLLGDSGAAVARILGELTNVNLILEAVREANRQRASAAATLRTREADLKELVVRAGEFRSLPAQLAACDRAESALERALDVQGRLGRLQAATEALAVAEGVLSRTAVLLAVPEDATVQRLARRLELLDEIIRVQESHHRQLEVQRNAVAYHGAEEQRLEQELHSTLVAAGQCPTCGQLVT